MAVMKHPMKTINKVFLTLTVCIFIGYSMSVEAGEIVFTQGEKDFIDAANNLRVVSVDGIAPLSYIDSKGGIKGIGIDLFDEVSALTGLNFEFELYESTAAALASGFDIFTNMEKKYAPEGMLLSQPYLESETVLFYNKSLDPKQLEGKRFAAVAGGSLPRGIGEEHAFYFNDREKTINAVETGKADYGFGNAYSMAFYILQNGYKNIITIPTSKEERAYRVGVPAGSEVLLSIINKSIAAIDKSRMDALVLSVASHVERRITPSMIIDSYWREILGVLIVIFGMLGYIVFLTVRTKNRIATENKRYEVVAQISNNYLFEYLVKEEKLYVSEKLNSKIDTFNGEERISKLLKEIAGDFSKNGFDESNYTISLPLLNGDNGIFRVIFSYLKDDRSKVYSIIGKLVDITAEVKEKEHLITQAQLDGLTGLYNVTTSKEAIIKSMRNKPKDSLDALVIIDCDKFKEINDTYGHLQGNIVLKGIAKALNTTFRQTDILGRLGGDEFWVYMHAVPSAGFVQEKCRQLAKVIQQQNKDLVITVSMGIALLEEEITFEELFQKADDALYLVKKEGGAKIATYKEG